MFSRRLAVVVSFSCSVKSPIRYVCCFYVVYFRFSCSFHCVSFLLTLFMSIYFKETFQNRPYSPVRNECLVYGESVNERTCAELIAGEVNKTSLPQYNLVPTNKGLSSISTAKVHIFATFL